MKRHSILPLFYFYILNQLIAHCLGQYLRTGATAVGYAGSPGPFSGGVGGYSHPILYGPYTPGSYYGGCHTICPFNPAYGNSIECALALDGTLIPGLGYDGSMLSGVGYAFAGPGYTNYLAHPRNYYGERILAPNLLTGTFGVPFANGYHPTVGYPGLAGLAGLAGTNLVPAVSRYPAVYPHKTASQNSNANTNVLVNSKMGRHTGGPLGL